MTQSAARGFLASALALFAASAALAQAPTPPALPPTPERPPNQNAAQEFPYWGRPVAVAADSVENGRTAVGYDAVRNVTHLVWRDSGNNIRYANDDPTTRSASGFLSNSFIVGQGDTPRIAVDAQGSAHVVWATRNLGAFLAPSSVFYRRRDAAAGWQGAETLAETTTVDEPAGDCVKRTETMYGAPDVAADASNVAHILYAQVVDVTFIGNSCPTGTETRSVLYLKKAAPLSTETVFTVTNSMATRFALATVDLNTPDRIGLDDRPAESILVAHAVWTNVQGDASTFTSTAVHGDRGGGAWSAPPETLSVGSANPDLAIDSIGSLHFVFGSASGGAISYRAKSASTGMLGAVEPTGIFGDFFGVVADSRLQPHVASMSYDGKFRYAGRVLGAWRTGKGYSFFPRAFMGGDLVITPNDRLIAGLTARSVAAVIKTIDPDLGEQDAFAMFDVGPNASANLANGNLFFTAPLFSSRGVGISTSFSLIYNSLAFEPGLISQGWQHNYDIVLINHDRDNIAMNPDFDPGRADMEFISVRFGDGRVVEFKKQSSGIYLAANDPNERPPGVFTDGTFPEGRLAKYGHFSKVEKNVDSRNGAFFGVPYIMTGKFGLEFHFDANGRLTRLVDTNANTLALGYETAGASPEGNDRTRLKTLTDSAGRVTTLEYDAGGRLQKIKDPAFGANPSRYYFLNYSTGANPILTSVLFNATGDTWGFSHYIASDPPAGPFNGARVNLLSQVRTPRGQAAVSQYGTDFLYYQDNRLARSLDPAAPHVLEGGAEATFRAFRDILYTNPVPTGSLVAGHEYWNAVFTDARGNAPGADPAQHRQTIDYQYFRAIATRIEDPVGNFMERRHQTDFPLLTSVRDKRGKETFFTYHPPNPASPARDNVDTIQRPGSANPIRFTHTDDGLNRLKTVTDPVNTASPMTYNYDAKGNLREVVFPDAGEPGAPCKRQYFYDSRGRVTTYVSPNGHATTLGYTPAAGADVGLVATIQRPGPNGTLLKPETLQYNIMGTNTKYFMPEQPGKPTELNPPDLVPGGLEGRDRITHVKDPTGAVMQGLPDADSNLRTVKDPRQTAGLASGSTVLDYDVLDRATVTTNAGGDTMAHKYDANGMLRQESDFNGNVSKWFYDRLNRVEREEIHHAGSPALITTFEYDENGNVTKEIRRDAGTGTKTVERILDDRNRVVRRIEEGGPEGVQIEVYGYDDNDQRKVSTRRAVVSGDPRDMLTTPGVFTSGTAFDYDQRYRTAAQTDITIDPLLTPGQPPLGAKTVYAYDCDDNLASVTVGAGTPCAMTTTRAYDPSDRLIRITGPLTDSGASVIEYTYDDNDNLKTTRVDHPNGSGLLTVTTFNYNDRNEIISVVDANNDTTVRQYDLNGNLVLLTDPENCKTRFYYDHLNRLFESRVSKVVGADPDLLTPADYVRTTFEYDKVGNRVAVVDARGFRYEYVYDGLNRLTDVRNVVSGGPGGTALTTESFAYDEFGNLKSHTDPNGKFAEFAYDGLDRLVTETHWTDSSRTPPSILQIVRTYDASNNLATIDDGTTRIVNTYTTPADAPQPVNLVKRVDWSINGTAFKSVQYEYDACGKRVKLFEPEGAMVRYTYDAADRQAQILRTAPGDIERLFSTMAYDKGGRRKSTANGNGTTMFYNYDVKTRLERLQLATSSGKILSSFQYEYSPRDNRTKATLEHLGTTFSYGYDCLSRLTSESCTGTVATPPPFSNSFATQPGGNESGFSNEACAIPGIGMGSVPAYTASYTYDDSGNRLAKNDSRLGNFGCTYDSQNRLTTETFDHPPADGSVDETFTYTYDNNGNTLTRDIGGGVLHNYSYDYANRLKSFVKTSGGLPATSFSYTYAPGGQRVLKTNQLAGSTTAFMYDGADVVADYSVPMVGPYAPLKSYVQGLGIDSKFAEIDGFGATLFYNNDALGTVHQVVSTPPMGQEAQPASTQLTTAWGEDLLQPSQLTRYHFTQRERDDESDFTYMRARHYASRLGRFLQTDPIIANQPSARYSYAANNPLRYVDRFGMDITEEDWRIRKYQQNEMWALRNYPSEGNAHAYYSMRESMLAHSGRVMEKQGFLEIWDKEESQKFAITSVVVPDYPGFPPTLAESMREGALRKRIGLAFEGQIDEISAQITVLEWVDRGATVISLVSGGGAIVTMVRTVGTKMAIKHLGKEIVVDLVKNKLTTEGLTLAGVPPEIAQAIVGLRGGARSKARGGIKNAGNSSKGMTKTPDGVCFAAGTPVLTPSGHRKIEDLRVGQRVLTTDEGGDGATEVDPKTWRLVTLAMPNPDGSEDVIEIELLRSAGWIEKIGAAEGAEVLFGLPEMGLSGPARVLAISECPAIETGPGRVILATVTHLNGHLLEIRFEGADGVVEPTDTHRLYSETRGGWIAAGLLVVGERIETKSGSTAVESIRRKPGVHRVYNLEVETEHCYYAGEQAILSHNNNPCAAPVPKVYRGGPSIEATPRDIKIDPLTGHVKTTHGPSLHVDPAKVVPHGPPHVVTSVPDELQVIQRGQDPGHYEITPRTPMPRGQFQEQLNKVTLEPAGGS